MPKRVLFAKILTSLILVTSFSLGGCVTAKQKLIDSGIQPLTGDQLKEMFTKGVKADYVNAKGQASYVVFHPDGNQTLASSMTNDTGRWSVENDQQCSVWTKIRNGRKGCFTWFKVTENTYELFGTDGTKTGTLTIK